MPWHSFSHNEDLRGGDHFLVGRQTAHFVSLSVEAHPAGLVAIQQPFPFLYASFSVSFRSKRADVGLCVEHAVYFAVFWTVEVPFQIITSGIPNDEVPIGKRNVVPSL